MKKRILSLLLCCCMVLGLLPVPALAAESDSGSSTTASKEIDQSTYDALGLTLDAEAAASALTAPYSTTQSIAAFTASEVYVAANGAIGNVYALRNGLDRMDSGEADISDDYGNLDGAYAFYGTSRDIKEKNGGTTGSKLSSNQGNVMAKTGSDFNGIYATSVAFNGGDGKDNYVAELRAYGNNETTTVNGKSVKGKIEIKIYKIGANGVRTHQRTLSPTLNDSMAYGDVLSYFTRSYVQELDALFEIKAADVDGDGKDELFAYGCADYQRLFPARGQQRHHHRHAEYRLCGKRVEAQ